MNMIDDPLMLVADLKPAQLDHLADEGYTRHRHDDLARVASEGPGRPASMPGRLFPARPRRPRRAWLTGGIAVTATAAAVAAVLVTGAAPARHAPSPSSAPPAAPDARSFLLASAVIAAHAPATSGTYWYTRVRDVEPTTILPKTRPSKFKGPSKVLLPGITYAATEESWTGQTRARTIVDENLSFSFASAADRARWQAMGEPPLATADGTSTRPSTNTYHMTFRRGPGPGLTKAGVEGLPATAAGLGAALHRMWNSIPDQAAALGLPHPTFADYIFGWADALLSGPATPGTRAAFYGLLAQQPGIAIARGVTDPLGRAGVAISSADGGSCVVIDPQTAREIAYSADPVHADAAMAWISGVTVVEATGWTSQLGIPPTP